jgi:hypothetical protein
MRSPPSTFQPSLYAIYQSTYSTIDHNEEWPTLSHVITTRRPSTHPRPAPVINPSKTGVNAHQHRSLLYLFVPSPDYSFNSQAKIKAVPNPVFVAQRVVPFAVL